jgi:hypothetical protein
VDDESASGSGIAVSTSPLAQPQAQPPAQPPAQPQPQAAAVQDIDEDAPEPDAFIYEPPGEAEP